MQVTSEETRDQPDAGLLAATYITFKPAVNLNTPVHEQRKKKNEKKLLFLGGAELQLPSCRRQQQKNRICSLILSLALAQVLQLLLARVSHFYT